MKIYNLNRLIDSSPDGVYRLGPRELLSEAVELLYGRLRPKETGHIHSTPAGTEEIICVIKGSMLVSHAKSAFTVCSGEAFLSKERTSLTFANTGDSETVYISAIGRLNGPAAPAKTVKPNDPPSIASAPQTIVDTPEYDITREDVETLD